MDAPRGSVELEEAEELKRLRRRAYGQDADIAWDAAAQARLAELEAAQRRQQTLASDATARTPAPVPERVPVPEPVEGARASSTSVPQPVDGAFAGHRPVGESVSGHDPIEGPIADPDLINEPPAAPWWRRHRWLAILGVAIAALALIAAGAWMSQLLADGSAPIPTETVTAEMPYFPAAEGRPDYVPRPDYVLGLKSVGEVADRPHDPDGTLNALGISVDELRRYEDFQGPYSRSINVWSGESRYGMTCLLVAVSPPESGYGFSTEGCSLNGKDTILEGQMGSDSHARFVLRGAQVNVYVYTGVADPNSSQG